MAEEPESFVDIAVSADGFLSINGRPVTIENGRVENGCIVGALRAEGVYVPRISIPLEQCRMSLDGAESKRRA